MLPRGLREKYGALRDEKGVVKLGLRKSYELLRDLRDKLGFLFFENKRLQHLLVRRNESVLAHGIKPVVKEEFMEAFKSARELAEEVVPELEELMVKAKFPDFETVTGKV